MSSGASEGTLVTTPVPTAQDHNTIVFLDSLLKSLVYKVLV